MIALVPPAVEDEVVAIITRPLTSAETYAIGYEQKELELFALFTQLLPVQAMALHRRLACPRDCDRLAIAFTRLVADRRHRLLQVLAGARRRAALEGR